MDIFKDYFKLLAACRAYKTNRSEIIYYKTNDFEKVGNMYHTQTEYKWRINGILQKDFEMGAEPN